MRWFNRFIISYCRSSIFYTVITLCSIFATGLFVDQYILAKWLLVLLFLSFWGISTVLTPPSNISRLTFHKWFSFVCLFHTVLIILVSICVIVQIYVLGNWKNPRDSIYPFDNVAGVVSCIVPLIPFALHECRKHSKSILYVVIITAFIALLSTESRTGIISASVTFSVYCFLEKPRNKNYIVYPLILLAIVILPLIIILRPESVIGRLLVWIVSFHMIVDKPIFGFGSGGFERYYMDYQATYFSENPTSSMLIYSDNIRTPFNEYLLILVNFGCVGFIFFLLLVYLLFGWYRKSVFEGRNVALCSLLSISIMALSSYPLVYPFVWIIMIVNIIVLVPKKINFMVMRAYRSYNFSMRIILGALSFLLMSCTTKQISLERILYKYTSGDIKWFSKSDIPDQIRNSGLYMFEMSTLAYEKGNYELSIKLLKKCLDLRANYDTTLDLGIAYMKTNEYGEARQCMIKAHNMIPSRFYPLYYLAIIAEIEHKTDEKDKLCNEILSKKVKVYSSDILIIRHKAKKMLDDNT